MTNGSFVNGEEIFRRENDKNIFAMRNHCRRHGYSRSNGQIARGDLVFDMFAAVHAPHYFARDGILSGVLLNLDMLRANGKQC